MGNESNPLNSADEKADSRAWRNFWAWSKDYSAGITALAALSVPFLTAIGGWYVSSNASDREVRAQHLDIAIAILSDEKLSEQSTGAAIALRNYGVDLLEHSSPVELPPSVRGALIDGTLILPSSSAVESMEELARRTREAYDLILEESEGFEGEQESRS